MAETKTRNRKSVAQQLSEEKAVNKKLEEMTNRMAAILESVVENRTPPPPVIEKPVETEVKEEVKSENIMPAQPLPKNKNLFKKVLKTQTKLAPAVLYKDTGLYEEQIEVEKIPPDSRLWKHNGRYCYSLTVKPDGKYEVFEPTGESRQLPEKLWRAIVAAAIKKVFSYRNKGLEKLNAGLGITFLIICIFVLFIIGNMMMKGVD